MPIRLFAYRSSLRFLLPLAAFVFSAVVGIAFAAWVDAPNAPPNYGIVGCTPPCTQEDFQPMNLSGTPQTKRGYVTFEGDVTGNKFSDLQNDSYFIDPYSPLSGVLNGALNISQTDSGGAKLVVNYPSTPTKTGAFGDAVYAYANSDRAVFSAEQANPAGYAVYTSGGINYFGGNVGIGTTAPGAPLQISATPGGNTGLIHLRPAAGQKNYITFTENAVADQGAIGFDNAGTTMNFYTGGILDNGSVKMAIQSTGNVGIGTAAPGAKLQIENPGATNSVVSFSHDNTVYGLVGVNSVNNMLVQSNNVPMLFSTNGFTNEHMRITTAGNVGIGTTAPGVKLDVAGDSKSRGVIVDGGSTNYSTISLASDTNSNWWYLQAKKTTDLSGRRLSIIDANDNSEDLAIYPNGNVGIGTTAPGEKLEVTGRIKSSSGGFVFPDNTVQTSAASVASATVYKFNDFCSNSGLLTTNTTCQTAACEYPPSWQGGPPKYFQCNGSCSLNWGQQLTCNNNFIGYLVSQ